MIRGNTVPVFAATRFATQVSPDPADRFLASASRPLAKKQRKDALYFARKAGVNLVWAKNATGTKPKPDAQRPAAQVYFYHPDHLGTATLLTDINGQPYQYFLNLPFGEEMAAQRADGKFSTRYKFNGKELDKQTGYYYYGARYYDPVLSRWLSVDPLAEKNAGAVPYNFTLNNPIILIDPLGLDTLDVTRKDNKWVFTNYQEADGDDVIRVHVGKMTYSYNYSSEEDHIIFLNLPENTTDNFGIYFLPSGENRDATYGYFVTPGGTRSNRNNSHKTILPGIYEMVNAAGGKWETLSVTGDGGNDDDITIRGIKIHNFGYLEKPSTWGSPVETGWTKGCFVLASEYRVNSETNHVEFNYFSSRMATFNLLYNLGGNISNKLVGNHYYLKATFDEPIQYKLYFKDSNIP